MLYVLVCVCACVLSLSCTAESRAVAEGEDWDDDDEDHDFLVMDTVGGTYAFVHSTGPTNLAPFPLPTPGVPGCLCLLQTVSVLWLRH